MSAALTSACRAWRFWMLFSALLLLIGSSVYGLSQGRPETLFSITAGYLIYDTGIGLILLVAAGAGVRDWLRQRTSTISDSSVILPRLSVLIAAHNERLCLLETLPTVFAQRGVSFEIIIASDGSTDGMNELLIRQFHLTPAPDSGGQIWLAPENASLRLLALPKAGKAAALNAAAALAREEILVTLDADTRLAPEALAELARAFQRPEVAAAGGFLYVRNTQGRRWLAHYQFTEYIKNFVWRMGLTRLGVCLQVSGAFGALRASVLRQLGGFAADSLTEDYEIIFRLHARFQENQKAAAIVTVPGAVAYTEVPETAGNFIRQRTRWFTGFLQTLWDYRHLVGQSRYGAVGTFMLPVKCVDAVLPLWGFLSLGILIGALASGRESWQRTAVLFFFGKWAFDLATFSLMFHWHRRIAGPHALHQPFGLTPLCLLTEGFVFHWFRQIAVLQAYWWFFRRIKKWEQTRWQTTPSSV